MRKVLWAILALIILLAAAGAALLGRVDTAFVVRQIAAATARATGRPLVFVSAPHIAFFPPGVRFGEARWGEAPPPAGAETESPAPQPAAGLSLTVKGGMAQLEWAALLRGRIVVREVRLDAPVLRLGAAALAPGDARKNDGAAPDPAAAQKPLALPAALPVELDRLVLRQGSVLWTDAAGRTARLEDLNVSLEQLRSDAEATLQCDFAFSLPQGFAFAAAPAAAAPDKAARPGPDGSAAPLTGTLALSAKLRYAPPELRFRQTSVTVTPLGGHLPEKAGPLQLAAEGALRLDPAQGPQLRLDKARLTTPQAHVEARGTAGFAPLSAAVDLEFEAAPRRLAAIWGRPLTPAPAGGKDALAGAARVVYAADALDIPRLTARLDAAALTGAARLRLHADGPLELKADLHADVLDLNALPLPAATAPAAPAPAAEAAGNNAAAAAHERRAAADRAALPGLDLHLAADRLRYDGLTLRAVRLALKGSAGRYALTEAAADLETGGAVRATGNVDLPGRRCALKGTAAAVRLGPLLQALGQGSSVDGLADLRADLRGDCASAAALSSSLTGEGLLEIRRLRPGGAASQPIPGLVGKRALVPETFDLVRAPFTVKEGLLVARPVTVTAKDFNAKGEAALSLPRQHLDAGAEVRTLGLAVPVVIKGPLQHLSYGVDPRFALDVAGKLPGVLLDTGGKAGAAGGEAVKGAGGLLRQLLGK